MARFNNNGEEITSPFLYCETPQYRACLDINHIPEEMKKSGNVKVDFNPCKDFRFMVAKDKECNIDIYIHTNPKHIVNNLSIPIMFGKIKKALK